MEIMEVQVRSNYFEALMAAELPSLNRKQHSVYTKTSLLNFRCNCVFFFLTTCFHFQDALWFELQNATDVLEKESIPGAKKFATGVGRGGTPVWTSWFADYEICVCCSFYLSAHWRQVSRQPRVFQVPQLHRKTKTAILISDKEHHVSS